MKACLWRYKIFDIIDFLEPIKFIHFCAPNVPSFLIAVNLLFFSSDLCAVSFKHYSNFKIIETKDSN